jgi:hypothetical protein
MLRSCDELMSDVCRAEIRREHESVQRLRRMDFHALALLLSPEPH